MRLLKLEVEEGFLHGLNLEFSPGLNVLIGPRGAGKTSVIELIRFCLGAPAYTPANEQAARDHALSILRGGQCILTAELDGEVHEFARSAEDERPVFSRESKSAPIVLSQNEIEKVGLDARGRIRLLDDFLDDDQSGRLDEGRLRADIASLTQEIHSHSETIARLDEEIIGFGDVEKELSDAEQEQDIILEGFSQLEPQRKELAEIDEDLVALGTRRDLFDEADENISLFLQNLTELREEADKLIPEQPVELTKDDDFKAARSVVTSMGERLGAAQDEGDQVLRGIRKKAEAVEQKHKTARSRGRVLRSKLDEVQAGAGEVSRRITQLREKLNGREAAKKKIATARNALKKLQAKRKNLLKDLDGLRERRFKMRREVASALSKELGPQLKVSVARYGVLDQYAEAIALAMQGSRLRYKTLAPRVAERMTPAELVEAVEDGQVKAIASAVQITSERAEKIVDVLRSAGTEGILKAEIEDAVEIGLLDGPDYKVSPDLSTGQRCTAVLPILLSHIDRTLIMDQPEDHLDNAYVADTVVRALHDAPKDAQLIMSTHNANIPVLGEADLVTLLESDGRRGFVRSSEPLDHPKTVSAITRVMEGGEEAFRLRAQFYSDHDSRR